MTTTPEYRRAGTLYAQGRVAEAAEMLDSLLARDEDDLDVRHALARCLTDLGRVEQARRHLELIVARAPDRRDDMYRLAGLSEQTGDQATARDLYRTLLAAGPYRDARARLEACEPRPEGPGVGGVATVMAPSTGTQVVGHHPWTPPPIDEYVVAGPVSLREIAESSNNTSRGRLVRHLRQPVRHRLATFARMLAFVVLAIAVAVALSVAAHRLPDDWLSTFGAPRTVRPLLSGASTAVVLIAVTGAAVAAGWQVLSALRYTVDVYERGVELAEGIVPRRRTFYWYDRLTDEPAYVRAAFWSYLTRTASLEFIHDSGAEHRTVTLDGVGDPATVLLLREYLERRRYPERRKSHAMWG